MLFFSLFKKDKVKPVKIKENDKVAKKITKISKNLSKETEIYIKNNLAKFLLILIAVYNYENSAKIAYLPILLFKKLFTNISTITNTIENL